MVFYSNQALQRGFSKCHPPPLGPCSRTHIVGAKVPPPPIFWGEGGRGRQAIFFLGLLFRCKLQYPPQTLYEIKCTQKYNSLGKPQKSPFLVTRPLRLTPPPRAMWPHFLGDFFIIKKVPFS